MVATLTAPTTNNQAQLDANAPANFADLDSAEFIADVKLIGASSVSTEPSIRHDSLEDDILWALNKAAAIRSTWSDQEIQLRQSVGQRRREELAAILFGE